MKFFVFKKLKLLTLQFPFLKNSGERGAPQLLCWQCIGTRHQSFPYHGSLVDLIHLKFTFSVFSWELPELHLNFANFYKPLMTLSSTTNLSSYFSFTLIGTHVHWYCVVPQMGYKHRNRTSIFLNHLLLHNSLNTRSILVWLWSCGVLKVAQMTSLTPPFVWITCFITVSSTDYLFLFSNVSKITDQLFVVKRYRTESDF